MTHSAPLTTPSWQAAVRRRTTFYLLVAALLAVLFGVLVFYPYAQRQGVPIPTTQAIFARIAIEAGAAITAEMVEARRVPFEALPVAYFAYPEQVIGQVALYPLVAGEAVLPHKLFGAAGGPLAQRCPSGYWCVSIPAEWFIATPPDLAEGDRLEIAAVQPGNPMNQAGFIATEVRVVALPGEGSTYVLAVSDQEALSLLYAHANQFQILVLLRPSGD